MRKLTVAVALIMLAAACGGQRGTSSVAHFGRGLGLATAPETIEKTHRVLGLHQFDIEQDEGPPSIYIETRWKDRTPFADEQALGIDAAQIRAMVRARPRSTTSTLGEVYTVDMTIEQRVRLMGSMEWVHHTITAEARAHAAEIAEMLRRELDVGVRRF
jgi:hypothetical protein